MKKISLTLLTVAVFLVPTGCEVLLSPFEVSVQKELNKQKTVLEEEAAVIQAKEKGVALAKIAAERIYQIAGIDYHATIAELDVDLSELQNRRTLLDSRWDAYNEEANRRLNSAASADNFLWSILGFGGALATGTPLLATWLPRARQSWKTTGKKDTAGFFRDQLRFARENVPAFNQWITSDTPEARAFREAISSDPVIHDEVVRENLHKPRAHA